MKLVESVRLCILARKWNRLTEDFSKEEKLEDVSLASSSREPQMPLGTMVPLMRFLASSGEQTIVW